MTATDFFLIFTPNTSWISKFAKVNFRYFFITGGSLFVKEKEMTQIKSGIKFVVAVLTMVFIRKDKSLVSYTISKCRHREKKSMIIISCSRCRCKLLCCSIGKNYGEWKLCRNWLINLKRARMSYPISLIFYKSFL